MTFVFLTGRRLAPRTYRVPNPGVRAEHVDVVGFAERSWP
jgi:hypothetical protein